VSNDTFASHFDVVDEHSEFLADQLNRPVGRHEVASFTSQAGVLKELLDDPFFRDGHGTDGAFRGLHDARRALCEDFRHSCRNVRVVCKLARCASVRLVTSNLVSLDLRLPVSNCLRE
jgi:hypothetical protein